MLYCGICGTDIHIYNVNGGYAAVTPLLVPGHQFLGVVTAAGIKFLPLK